MIENATVIKIGGSVPPEPVLDDVAAHVAEGTPVVLVHGGGQETDRLARRLGTPLRVLVSPDGTRSRRTDDATLDLLAMALLGGVKPKLVQGLHMRGITAFGMSGADGALVLADRRAVLRSVEDDRVRLIRDDRSGRVTDVSTRFLRALMAAGATPVISPPAMGDDGGLLNVDADWMAARIAVALNARALVLLTDTPGVLADPEDTDSSVRMLDVLPDFVSGRMRHKVRAALYARRAGVRAVVSSGAIDRPVRMALLGAGTEFTAAEEGRG
ncbi:[LysW]-aminoadipate kinase [Nocardiopsis alkaliphila]|uniref:[LysW]-aminoadipate kinase n=1 Tax=Nocardiopsis alkaliphila TaxID=225762 RepID=UPI001EF9FB74|nr:[LysW]-aminoadipate kinase [Nocardiopsis alkaliphila]